MKPAKELKQKTEWPFLKMQNVGDEAFVPMKKPEQGSRLRTQARAEMGGSFSMRFGWNEEHKCPGTFIKRIA
jgi:hypothetical protein